MKHPKLFTAVRNVLCCCMALSWWISANRVSLVFFGEPVYPKKENQ